MEVNFLSIFLFQEYQDICSNASNEVMIDQIVKSRIFFTKSARARTFAEIRSKQKMHVMYIILSSHAKNQPPTTCKICAKMTHNETAGYYRAGQSALILILTPEMNSSCPITYKSTHNM